MSELINLIQQVGFPIAGCIVLFFSYRESNKNMIIMMNDFKDALDKNTCAIKDLSTKLKD